VPFNGLGAAALAAGPALKEKHMAKPVTDVTDATFEADVLRAERPVLVDYWAAWCTPCKMIAPLVADSAEAYAGRLDVAKVNVDENPATPSRYRVRSIPTLMLFKRGQVVATHVGALSKSQLAAFIDAALETDSGAPARAAG
jgi:thioredoxin 1